MPTTPPLLADLDTPLLVTSRTRRATRLRLVGVFRRGWTRILVALLRQAPIPLAHFVPEPWPTLHHPGPPRDAPASALLRPVA